MFPEHAKCFLYNAICSLNDAKGSLKHAKCSLNDTKCSQVVPAKYAFVLHTANPLTGNTDEMLGEVSLLTPSLPLGWGG